MDNETRDKLDEVIRRARTAGYRKIRTYGHEISADFDFEQEGPMVTTTYGWQRPAILQIVEDAGFHFLSSCYHTVQVRELLGTTGCDLTAAAGVSEQS